MYKNRKSLEHFQPNLTKLTGQTYTLHQHLLTLNVISRNNNTIKLIVLFCINNATVTPQKEELHLMTRPS